MFALNTNNQSGQQNEKADAHQKACELQFFAQPYSLDAVGFYFGTLDEYEQKAAALLDSFGNPVEEFELQFIDGSDEESALFHACGVNQANLGQFFAIIDEVPEYQFSALFYLCDVLGCTMADAMNKLDDVNIYTGELKDAATELFDECYASQIPENLRQYINYDSFATDCEMGGDMTEFEFAGTTYTCTNASGF